MHTGVVDNNNRRYRLAKAMPFRVAQNHGGPHAAKQVAFLWAKTLGGESAVKLLSKFGILEAGIDYACESYQFEFAFELAKTAMKEKMMQNITTYGGDKNNTSNTP